MGFGSKIGSQGVGGGYAPSCVKCGKLKHVLILVLSKSHLSNTSGDV